MYIKVEDNAARMVYSKGSNLLYRLVIVALCFLMACGVKVSNVQELNAAISNVDVDLIEMSSDSFNLTAPLIIERDLSIIESDLYGKPLILGTNLDESILQITEGSVTLQGLEITSGNAKHGNGAAIHAVNVGKLNIIDCDIHDNGDDYTTLNGGALYLDSSNVYIQGGKLKSNKANNGGAIAVVGRSDVNIIGSVLSDNQAEYRGGAILIGDEIANQTFKDESGTYPGVKIFTTTIANNMGAEDNGGGIWMKDGSLATSNVRITNNVVGFVPLGFDTQLFGGGLFVKGGGVSLNNTFFDKNRILVSSTYGPGRGGGFAVLPDDAEDVNTFALANVTFGDDNEAFADPDGWIDPRVTIACAYDDVSKYDNVNGTITACQPDTDPDAAEETR